MFKRSRVLLMAAGLAACDFFNSPGGNPTAALRIMSGDGQEAVAGSELPLPLVVVAEDAEGRPLASQRVDFVVLSGGGSMALGTVTTDETGQASDRWTLGGDATTEQRVEARVVNGDGEAVLAAQFTAEAMSGGPARLVKIGGDGQTGAPGERLPDSLAVRVEDQHGNPVGGVTVTWSAASGSISPGEAVSGANGIARTSWRLGTAAGSYSAEAQVADVEPVTFSAGTSFNGTTLTKIAGDGQLGAAGGELPQPLVVELRNASGQPIRDAWVRWRPAPGDGTVAPDSAPTDAAGRASARWTLPAAVGARTLLADVAGQASATFTATATAGTAATITLLAGNGQLGDVGEPLADSLAVELRDAAGNPVSGDTVTWAVTAGGAGAQLTPTVSVTNVNGVARVAWRLGLKADEIHGATATRAGAGTVAFTATARVPATLVMAKTGGDAQTGRAGAALVDSLEVTVRLPDGRPVEGVRVTWSGDGTLAAGGPRSSATGRVRARWTLGGTPGAQRAVARRLNDQNIAVDSVTFSATAQAGSPATIAVLGGNGQTANVGAPLTDSLAVIVRDAGGAPVPNATITWSVTGGGGGIAPASSVTGANGVARAAWTLGLEADVPHTATASVAGAAGPAHFTATATLPASLVIVRTAGDSQTAVAGAPLPDSLVVTVRLSDGRTVKGVQVSWTAGQGGTVGAAAPRSGTDGQVRARWTLGPVAGPQAAVARWHTTQGAPADSVTFTATATAPPPGVNRQP